MNEIVFSCKDIKKNQKPIDVLLNFVEEQQLINKATGENVLTTLIVKHCEQLTDDQEIIETLQLMKEMENNIQKLQLEFTLEKNKNMLKKSQ